MKILIATGIYPPDIGGPATYSKLLSEKLPAHSFDVTVLSFSDVRSFPRIIRHGMYFFRVLLATRGVDLIYAQDPVSVGLPAMLAAKIARKRFLLKIVGDYAWEQGVQRFGVEDRLDMFSARYEHYPLPVRILKSIEYYVAHHAERVIVPSEYLRQIVQNWGIPEDHIAVIYNSFDIRPAKESKDELRRVLHLEGNVVISVGRLVPWKGFYALIEAFPEILRLVPNAKLLIIGDGPLRSSLERLTKELSLEAHVRFLGSIEQETLLKYLKASDVFVLNTDYEGFSHQLLEVMASDLPLVTTPVGGNVELVRDNENGLFFDQNDRPLLAEATVRVLASPELAVRLAEQARRDLERFSEDAMITRLVALINATPVPGEPI